MKRPLRKIEIIGLLMKLLFTLQIGISQNYNFNLSEIDIAEQLPSLDVLKIFMDSKGYMWFGTAEGLARYDGSNVKKFIHNPNDSLSISNNFVHDIIEDQKGHIWITTRGGGLNRFNPVTETFRRFLHNPSDPSSISSNQCNRLFIDSDSLLWITTYTGGFNKYLPKTESFQRFSIDTSYKSEREKERLNSSGVILEDSNDKNILWIGYQPARIVKFHKKTHELTYYPYDNWVAMFDPTMLDDNEIWMGTWGNDLATFDIASATWTDISLGKIESVFIQNRSIIRQLEIKSPHELWLADGDIGLGIYNTVSQKFFQIRKPKKSWMRITRDHQNRLWLADNEGVKTIDPYQQLFQRQELNASYDLNFVQEHPNAVYLDQKGKLYIAEEGDGIFKFDFQTKEVEHFNPVIPGYTADIEYGWRYMDVSKDKKGNLWAIGFWKLVRWNPNQLQFELFYDDSQTSPGQPFTAYQILEDCDGNLWVSGFEYLLKILPEDNTFKKFELPVKRTFENYLELSPDCRYLWISLNHKGVTRFDLQKEAFTELYSNDLDPSLQLHDGRTYDIETDQQGRLWKSARGCGIQIIDPNLKGKNAIIDLYMGQDLPLVHILDIECDINGNIWLLSSNKLIRYLVRDNTYKVYDGEQGLHYSGSTLSELGMKALDNGYLCIYDFDGFQYFHVDSIPFNERPPELVFSWFKTFEKEKKFDENLNYLEEITLPYSENFFSIGFSALNYTQPEENRYAYQLEGFDPRRVEADKRNYATYTNIPEGTYTFHVIAANNDGVWNETGIKIKIRILPPFYRSNLAYLAYFMLLALVVYGIYKFQRRRWEIRTALRLEQEESIRLKELDHTKNKLFTNITHEFRTPLTIINGIAQEIKGNEDAKKLINRNANILLRLINQMLDLAKVESGNMPIHLKQDNIVVYLKYLCNSFQSLAFSKHINLTFQSSEASIVMDYDAEKIDSILSNLITNAIKFTPEFGKVLVKVKRNAEQLQIEVSDTGIGMEPEERSLIFDRFQQVDASSTRQGEGTGIGLALVKELIDLLNGAISVESKVNEGSIFTVLLPIRNTAPLSAFKPEPPSPISLSKADLSATSRGVSEQSTLPALLIIEDNHDVITYLKMVLSDRYQLSVAFNGIDGVKQALAIIPDIIICDVMMPKKDGVQVTSELKNDERTSHIPIILLTAKGDQESKETGLQSGADAYLPKPFVKKELLIRLEQLILLRERLRKKYNQFDLDTSATKVAGEDKELIFLEKLNQVVVNNLENPAFQVDPDMCRALAMSKSQLYRKVSALLEVPPSKFIQNTRLKEARKLLISTDQKIAIIAQQVGINDPSYFTKIYTELFHEKPSETRKKLNIKS